MRGTPHWHGIERFVHETVAASEEHDLPVDDGVLMMLLAARLEPADLDQRKLPRSLLPEAALAQARFITGPPDDLLLPTPPSDAADRVARLWTATQLELKHDGTAADGLRLRVSNASLSPARKGPRRR